MRSVGTAVALALLFASAPASGGEKGKGKLPSVWLTRAGPGNERIAGNDRLEIGPIGVDFGCLNVTAVKGEVEAVFLRNGIPQGAGTRVETGETHVLCLSNPDEFWITCNTAKGCQVSWRFDRIT